MLLPVIVAPGNPHVLAQPPEYITPQDESAKQDCERAASKRWVTHHATHYAADNAILMGDDLYANQPLCEYILAHHLHFLFGCKPDSHQALYAALAAREAEVETVTVRKWKQQYLAQTLLTLNLLAFLVHTVTHLSNKIYRRLRKALGSEKPFSMICGPCYAI